MLLPTRHVLLALSSALALSACGVSPGDVTPFSRNLQGTAAVGAPLAGARISVRSSEGLERSTTADANGKFSIDIGKLTAPMLLKAEYSENGETKTLFAPYWGAAVGAAEQNRDVSVNTTVVTNITPLTDFIAVGSCSCALDAQYAAATTTSTDDKGKTTTTHPVSRIFDSEVAAKLEKSLRTAALKDLLIAASVTDADKISLLTTPFDANRQGLDKVLESLDYKRDSKLPIAALRNRQEADKIVRLPTASPTALLGDLGKKLYADNRFNDWLNRLNALASTGDDSDAALGELLETFIYDQGKLSADAKVTLKKMIQTRGPFKLDLLQILPGETNLYRVQLSIIGKAESAFTLTLKLIDNSTWKISGDGKLYSASIIPTALKTTKYTLDLAKDTKEKQKESTENRYKTGFYLFVSPFSGDGKGYLPSATLALGAEYGDKAKKIELVYQPSCHKTLMVIKDSDCEQFLEVGAAEFVPGDGKPGLGASGLQWKLTIGQPETATVLAYGNTGPRRPLVTMDEIAKSELKTIIVTEEVDKVLFEKEKEVTVYSDLAKFPVYNAIPESFFADAPAVLNIPLDIDSKGNPVLDIFGNWGNDSDNSRGSNNISPNILAMSSLPAGAIKRWRMEVVSSANNGDWLIHRLVKNKP